MSIWDWVRIVSGIAALCLAYEARRKNPQKKGWILFVIGGIGFVLTGAFHI
jgi:hypothetical membrane protein